MTNAGSQVRSLEPSQTRGEPRRWPSAAAWICVLLPAAACSNTTLDLWQREPQQPDLGLLAHWALDEGQPGPAADSSGFASHATPSTSPPVPTPDVPPVHFRDPFSLSFNGQDQWLQLGNPSILNLGGPTTMAAWARPAAINDTHNIVGHGYRWNPDHDFALRIRNGNYMFTTWNGADHAAVVPVPAADVGAWVHLCGVFDGTTYHIYRNGVLAASTADATLPPAGIDAIWGIGGRVPQNGTGVDYLWQGQLDDVRIYGRALSADEVWALYQR